MKKLFILLLAIFCVSTVFAKSYSEYLAEAKKYEEQKRWCYALGSYYDAMGTDDLPENKMEAFESYNVLKNAILSGNPGLGSFNLFTLHDEWKNLLMDAEKYGSSISIYDITVGNLEQGALDYKARTATYNAKVDYKLGDRYNKTILIIKEGYNKAYKSDWIDLPKEWPLYSASSNQDDNYNVEGALVYVRDEDRGLYLVLNYYQYIWEKLSIHCFNAFYQFEQSGIFSHVTPGLYDYKFNIVDENRKELVKGNRWLLGDGDKISVSGIAPEVMDLIDKGKAFINIEACYLVYGKYDHMDDNGGRTFIKNLPEIQLSMDKVSVVYGNSKTDKVTENVYLTMNYKAQKEAELAAQREAERKRLEAQQEAERKRREAEEAQREAERKQLEAQQEAERKRREAEIEAQRIAEEQQKNLATINSMELVSITDIQIKILKTEVTQALYVAVMGENPSSFIGDDLPVESVSWYDAIYFCNKLSAIKGLVPVYSVNGKTDTSRWNYTPHKGMSISSEIELNEQADGFRLPTENDWRNAINGSESYDYAGSDDINEVGWYNLNSEGKTHVVAQKKANEYGLYDMTGNVLEWYWDISGTKGYLYGGGFNAEASECRVVTYSKGFPREKYNNVGFRIVCSDKEQINEVLNSIELINIDNMQIQMLKTEVTQALYVAVMGEKNNSRFRGGNLPVESVSWYDAIYFCNKLSEIKGFTPVYSVKGKTDTSKWDYMPHNERSIIGKIEMNEQADGFRLPTENDWRNAINGSRSYNYAGSDDINEVGWYKLNSEGKTHPVAQKKANEYGLYDMTGNVWEWYWNTSGNQGYMYGGGINNVASECRVIVYNKQSPDKRFSDVGFRIVRSIK